MSQVAEDQQMVLWDPERALQDVPLSTAQLSRGFMQCDPRRWFPGFPAYWVPLLHSLGAEVRLGSITPVIGLPTVFEVGFVATVDDEAVVLAADPESMRPLVEAFVPTVGEPAREIVLEYMARRFFRSVAASWSGPQQSQLLFQPNRDPNRVEVAGTFKLSIMVNGLPVVVWFGCGPIVTQRLDELWRRQVQSSSQSLVGLFDAFVEIAELAVPPARLAEYVRSGTAVDLEVAAQDDCVLRWKGKPGIAGKLRRVENRYAFESSGESAPLGRTAEGTTRVSVVIARSPLTTVDTQELMQKGACLEFPALCEPKVELIVNGERIAEADLCTFEGRFAVKIR